MAWQGRGSWHSWQQQWQQPWQQQWQQPRKQTWQQPWQQQSAPAPKACKREPDRKDTASVKRRRSSLPLWEELPEADHDQLRENLKSSIESLQVDKGFEQETSQENIASVKASASLESLHAEFKKLLESTLTKNQPVDSKIHVGLMDYMGESHEEYRRDLDFLETTNTWFDTDSKGRRKVHYLPEECGWQEPALYEDLACRVEDGFRLVLKVSHVATHLCKLERPQEWWPRLWEQKYSRCASGVVAFLWQFPPSFRFQPNLFERLSHLFTYLAGESRWSGLRHIVDFRHGSWYNEEVYNLLRERRVCLAWLNLQNTGWAADLPSGWTPTVQTTDFTFIRLFGNEDRCTGWYDKQFLQDLYMLCPRDAHSYVLFGNKATKADPEPLVTPCSLNAREFRSIFSTVDLVARIGWILNRGRCPRRLAPEEMQVVSSFFIRFSERARRTGVQLQMPVWVVATGDSQEQDGHKMKRCFEWRPADQAPFKVGVYDAKAQDDIAGVARQLTGMEDVEIVDSISSKGPRQLEDGEARFVNATFIRYSPRARDAGVLQMTAVDVVNGKDGGLAFRWKAATTSGEHMAKPEWWPATGDVHLAELSCEDLRNDISTERDVWDALCELKGGTPLEEEPSNTKDPVPKVAQATKLPSAASPVGRTPNAAKLKDEAEVEPKAAPGKSRTWDPATGQWLEEELPADILQMMGGGVQDSDVLAISSTIPFPERCEASELDFKSVVSGAKQIMAEFSTFFGLPGA